jgi:putative transposase
VAIEVTGDAVVVVNPAQCGEAAAGKANHRNGYSIKTVLTETSRIGIKIPCDREGTFDPKLIQRYQSRFPG